MSMVQHFFRADVRLPHTVCSWEGTLDKVQSIAALIATCLRTRLVRSPCLHGVARKGLLVIHPS